MTVNAIQHGQLRRVRSSDVPARSSDGVQSSDDEAAHQGLLAGDLIVILGRSVTARWKALTRLGTRELSEEWLLAHTRLDR